jgi:hypothetical protein
MFKCGPHAAYLFAVAMRNEPVRGTFRLPEVPPEAKGVEVLDASCRLTLRNGGFANEFGPYEPHVYRIANKCRARQPEAG